MPVGWCLELMIPVLNLMSRTWPPVACRLGLTATRSVSTHPAGILLNNHLSFPQIITAQQAIYAGVFIVHRETSSYCQENAP